ncbi:MAG: chorismate mutase [Lachnospiraceae bacterium]|nr:chorismate mutase [Lachnospiraceae bacterium]
MNLEDTRRQIDRIDGEMKELFAERMRMSLQVAKVKADTKDQVYKPVREQDMLNTCGEGLSQEVAAPYRALLRKIVAISREYQYSKLLSWQAQPEEVSALLQEWTSRPELPMLEFSVPAENTLGAVLSVLDDLGIGLKSLMLMNPAESGRYRLTLAEDTAKDEKAAAALFQLWSETEAFALVW